MEADFGAYGVRRSAGGWKRSTSYHPYELRQGNAEEKVEVSASGTGKRLLERVNGNGHANGNGHKAEEAERAPIGAGTVRATGGQARSPFDRFTR